MKTNFKKVEMEKLLENNQKNNSRILHLKFHLFYSDQIQILTKHFFYSISMYK